MLSTMRFLVALWIAMATPTIAFTRTSGIQQSSSVLGPIARNGLGYEEVSVGSGRRILPGDTVYCYYVGSFMEGTQKNPFGMTQEGGVKKVFDSVTEGEPFRFSVGKGEVIQGMDLGILGGLDGEIPPMYAGGKRNLLIPSRLAYGEQELGPIPANQDLEFELEILEATPRKSAVGLKTRVGGTAAALGIPVIILIIAYSVVSNM